MKIKGKVGLALIFGLLGTFYLSGCYLLEGGMNTVDPPSLSTEGDNPPQESILKDLSPVRARDMVIAERQDDHHSD